MPTGMLYCIARTFKACFFAVFNSVEAVSSFKASIEDVLFTFVRRGVEPVPVQIRPACSWNREAQTAEVRYRLHLNHVAVTDHFY